MISNIDIAKLKKIFAEKGQQISQIVNSIIHWTNIIGKPAEYPPEDHEHVIADITDLTINKYDATTAPTTSDDSGEGYSVGSIWINVTSDLIYQCADATEDNAVWKCLSSIITDDAPSDGNTYGRRNGDWYEFSGGEILVSNLIFALSPNSLAVSLFDNFSSLIIYAE